MRTRRNRKGGASFFDSFASAVGIKPTTPDSSASPDSAPPSPDSAPPSPTTSASPPENKTILERFKETGTSASNFFRIGIKNELDPDFQTEIDKLKTAFTDIDAFKS